MYYHRRCPTCLGDTSTCRRRLRNLASRFCFDKDLVHAATPLLKLSFCRAKSTLAGSKGACPALLRFAYFSKRNAPVGVTPSTRLAIPTLVGLTNFSASFSPMLRP